MIYGHRLVFGAAGVPGVGQQEDSVLVQRAESEGLGVLAVTGHDGELLAALRAVHCFASCVLDQGPRRSDGATHQMP
jgi:hypothetical protein